MGYKCTKWFIDDERDPEDVVWVCYPFSVDEFATFRDGFEIFKKKKSMMVKSRDAFHSIMIFS